MRVPRLGRPCFAAGLIGLGLLGLAFGDFPPWQPVPAWVPARTALAYLVAAAELVLGGGLLWARVRAPVSRVVCAFLLAWWVLLDVPRVVAKPLVEGSWLAAGEIATLVAAGWVLLGAARGRGDAGARGPRLLLGLALIPIGLSHFSYLQDAAGMVPGWLPHRTGWAVLAGLGHIAAGLGILAGVLPRLAAAMETGMITLFTLLVWLPAVVATPHDHMAWSEVLVSWFIGTAVWVVADAYGDVAWTARGRSPFLRS